MTMAAPAATTRAARADDAGWIRALIPRLHAFGPPDYRSTAQMDAAEMAATVAAIDGGSVIAPRIVLVAEDAAGARLGFVHVETKQDFFTRERHGHVSTIVVVPEAEHQGVGRVLVRAAETWTRDQGYRLLTLNVFEQNEAARRLYERCGFGVDTIRYLKRLDR
jgi:ribosomal protein S18 acetylase RimI-like enzyme